LNIEMLLCAINSFPNGSSGGLDGIRPQHIKEMFLNQHNPASHPRQLETLLSFCDIIMQGKLPNFIRPLFFGARLIALRKKDENIRPIAVGNCFRRIVSKIACMLAKTTISNYLIPHQIGFAIDKGAEAAIHTTRSFLENNKDCMIVKIDYKNAFNCVNRDIFMHEIKKFYPDIYPYVHSSYNHDSILLFNDNTILSQEGAQQGDPLGPLLFCMAIQPIVNKLKSRLNVWYLDDGTIGDTQEVVMSDFEYITEESKRIGLEINISKCETVGNIDRNSLQHEIKILPNNEVFLLGASLNKDSTDSLLTRKLTEISKLIERLKILPRHCAMFILRNSFTIPRFNYILRTTPCFDSIILKDIDIMFKVAIEETLNIHLTESSHIQASLPVYQGGLGIRNTEDLSLPAYLSSTTATTELSTKIISDYRHSAEYDLAMLKWNDLTGNQIPNLPQIQKSWDNIICKNKFVNLLSIDTNVITQARLQSNALKHAGVWLNALPSAKIGNLLSDEEMRISACFRLGIQIYEEHICKCGAVVDKFGAHSFSCKRNNGKMLRHNIVNSIISKSLTSAGLQNKTEPSNLINANNLRPDGITLIPFKRGKSLVWDVTLPHPLAVSHLQNFSPGKSATNAENKKLIKYVSLVENYQFVPIAIETTGGYATLANSIIKDIGKLIEEKSGDKRSTEYLFQRISIGIQRGNVKTVLFSLT
jgi:hypothetical protein